MSRRSIGWLALLLILSGAPARQVEAAADLARTMAEAGGGDRVEEQDGGVGDDSLEATLGDDSTPQGLGEPDAIGAWLPMGAGRGVPSLVPLLSSQAGPDLPARVEIPSAAGRRQARLGRFLF